MARLIKSIEHKILSGVSKGRWHLVGKRRYFKEGPFLKKPELSEQEGDWGSKKAQYYRDGFVLLNEDPYVGLAQTALASFRGEFSEAIQIYDAPEGDKRIVRVDDQRRQWSGGTASGVIRLLYEDQEHPAYEAVFGKEHADQQRKKKVATVQDLYARYPFMQELVENSSLVSMARYANDNDSHPIVVQIERKVYSRGSQYNFIHFDALQSAFKAYLYLTDVEENSGPIVFSKGSHHWKRYPQMLSEMMANRKTRFTKEDVERYGLQPLVPIYGKAGTLFCFTSNAVHAATNVAPGQERWSIHLYYYSPKPYSTDLS